MMAARQIEARKFWTNLGMACEDAADIFQPADAFLLKLNGSSRLDRLGLTDRLLRSRSHPLTGHRGTLAKESMTLCEVPLVPGTPQRVMLSR